MKPNDYRDIIRTMQCSFCTKIGEFLVSWHHLKFLHQGGVSLKHPSAFAIPSCSLCHDGTGGQGKLAHCHNFGISKESQLIALEYTWENVLIDMGKIDEYTTMLAKFSAIEKQEPGMQEEWRLKGELFWLAIGGE